MTIGELRKALTIFASYVDEDESWVSADHDIIIFPLIEVMDHEDIEKLSALGAGYGIEVENHWYAFV